MIIYNTIEREETNGDVVTTESVATATVDGLYLEIYIHGQTESEIQAAFQLAVDSAEMTEAVRTNSGNFLLERLKTLESKAQ